MTWLAQDHPHLVARYESLYAHGSYASPSYRKAFEEKARPLLDKHGFGRGSSHRSKPPNDMHAPPRASTQSRGPRPQPSGIVEAPGPTATSDSATGWGEPDPTTRFRRPPPPKPTTQEAPPTQQPLF